MTVPFYGNKETFSLCCFTVLQCNLLYFTSLLLCHGVLFFSLSLSVPLQKETIGDLLIVNAQLSQAGMYTCTAQTVVDSASASAKLVVRGKMYQSCFNSDMKTDTTRKHLCNCTTYREKDYKQKLM